MPEPPFSVIMAGYVIDHHGHSRCSKCTDSGCPRLDVAEARIWSWRVARLGDIRAARSRRD